MAAIQPIDDMTTPEHEDRNTELPSWLRTLYQLAHSDIRWMKEQAWRVVNWTLLLYGAVLGIAKYFLPKVSPFTIVLVDAAVLIVAIIYLVELHASAAATRRNAARIEEQIPDGAKLWEPRTHDTNHIFYLGVQLIVVIASFALIVAAHLHLA